MLVGCLPQSCVRRGRGFRQKSMARVFPKIGGKHPQNGWWTWWKTLFFNWWFGGKTPLFSETSMCFGNCCVVCDFSFKWPFWVWVFVDQPKRGGEFHFRPRRQKLHQTVVVGRFFFGPQVSGAFVGWHLSVWIPVDWRICPRAVFFSRRWMFLRI